MIDPSNSINIGSKLLLLGTALLCCVIARNLGGLASWLRTAWMLRNFPKGSNNIIYGGLIVALKQNRLRALERMNEQAVKGSGVFYLNVLWRQVHTDALRMALRPPI